MGMIGWWCRTSCIQRSPGTHRLHTWLSSSLNNLTFWPFCSPQCQWKCACLYLISFIDFSLLSRRYDKVRPILASYINCLVVHDKMRMCLDFLTGWLATDWAGLRNIWSWLMRVFMNYAKYWGRRLAGLLVMIVMNYFVFTSSQLSTPSLSHNLITNNLHDMDTGWNVVFELN